MASKDHIMELMKNTEKYCDTRLDMDALITDENRMILRCQLQNGAVAAVIGTPDPKLGGIIFVTLFGTKIKKEEMAEVLGKVNKVNCYLHRGCFVVDKDDDLRFDYHLTVPEDMGQEAFIREAIIGVKIFRHVAGNILGNEPIEEKEETSKVPALPNEEETYINKELKGDACVAYL